MFSIESLADYWSASEMAINIAVFFNLLYAMLLGLIIGYERSYHGRAAGMRTYGLVCVASAALTVIPGYPAFWYGGHIAHVIGTDPTRVIQGIVTGVGFIGAGVIMKDGLNISGLTTAASIWAVSAIGIMVGVGFYAAAMLLTLLSVISLMWGAKLEQWLPSRQTVSIVLRFHENFTPREDELSQSMLELGYEIAWGSQFIARQDEKLEWHFVATTFGKNRETNLTEMAQLFTFSKGVDSYQLSHEHT